MSYLLLVHCSVVVDVDCYGKDELITSKVALIQNFFDNIFLKYRVATDVLPYEFIFF